MTLGTTLTHKWLKLQVGRNLEDCPPHFTALFPRVKGSYQVSNTWNNFSNLQNIPECFKMHWIKCPSQNSIQYSTRMQSARIWTVVDLPNMNLDCLSIWNFSRCNWIHFSSRWGNTLPTTIIVAILLVPISFQNKDNQPSFFVSWDGSWLPHGRKHCIKHVDHGFTFSFQLLYTDTTDPPFNFQQPEGTVHLGLCCVQLKVLRSMSLVTIHLWSCLPISH